MQDCQQGERDFYTVQGERDFYTVDQWGADDRGLVWLPWLHLNLTGALFPPLRLPGDTGLRLRGFQIHIQL